MKQRDYMDVGTSRSQLGGAFAKDCEKLNIYANLFIYQGKGKYMLINQQKYIYKYLKVMGKF